MSVEVKIATRTEVPEIGRFLRSIGKNGMSSEYLWDFDVWLTVRDMGGALIGCDALERRSKLLHGHSLAVRKDHRKQGIARAIIEHGFIHYMDSGDTRVVFTHFYNKKMYERMGFTMADKAHYAHLDDIGARELHRSTMVLIRIKE